MNYVVIYTFLFLSMLSCENKIGTSSLVDGSVEAPPTISINSVSNIGILNQSNFDLSGECSVPTASVSINIGGISRTINCTGSSWFLSGLDLSGLADGPVIITADMLTAVQASLTIVKDLTADSVLISSSPTINSSNETNYIITGSCSSSGSNVNISIGGIARVVTCNSNTWSTGVVDVSSLTDGNITVSVSHQSAPIVTSTVSKITGTPVISLLSVATTLSDSANLNWDIVSPGGFVINDYEINFRIKGISAWSVFNDGVSTNTFTTVTGLTSSSVYQFRVRVRYNTSLFSDWSSIAEGETQPSDTIFGPNSAMNVGGATTSRVAAFEDGTVITLNGAPLVTLNSGGTHQFTSSQFDLIDANKPIFTAGLRGASGDAGSSANIAWNPTKWAGRNFSFNATRTNPQVLEVYAIEDTTVEVRQGAVVLDTAIVTRGSGATLSWSVYGSYQVVSTGSILAYHMSTGGGALHDPKPLIPSFIEIIGFPSSSMRLTTTQDNTNYIALHSNSTFASGSLNRSNDIRINPQGTSSLFRGESLLITADKSISGASFADSNGLCAGAFIATNLMTRKHIIPTNSDYIAFASKSAGSIQVLNPAGAVVTTLNLSRSGANTGAPYRVRMANPLSGYRFISTVAVGAWYQPNNFTGAGDEDETLLYGTNE